MKKLFTLLAGAVLLVSACKSQEDPSLGFSIGSSSTEWNTHVNKLLSQGTLRKKIEVPGITNRDYSFDIISGEYKFPTDISLNLGQYNDAKLIYINLRIKTDSLIKITEDGDSIFVNSKVKFSSLLKTMEKYYGKPDSISVEFGADYFWKKKDFRIHLDKGSELPIDSLPDVWYSSPTLSISSNNSDNEMNVAREEKRKSLKASQMIKVELISPVVTKDSTGIYYVYILYKSLGRIYNEEKRGVTAVKLDISYKSAFNEVLWTVNNYELDFGINLKRGNLYISPNEVDGKPLLGIVNASPRSKEYRGINTMVNYTGEIKPDFKIKSVVFEDGEVLTD